MNRDAILYGILIILLLYLSIQLCRGNLETFKMMNAYDYSADVNSPFDRDADARRAEQAETLKRENTTQLVGNLFINNTNEVRKRMTSPDIEYYPRKQTIFDYSDIVL
jgi:hypothetical protein